MDARIMVRRCEVPGGGRNDRRLRHRRGCARVFSCAGVSLALLAQANQISAYSVSTHRIMTATAAPRARLPQIFPKLGYGPPVTELFPALAADTFGDGDIPGKIASDLIELGAAHEDDLEQIKRVLNHFYDPQANSNTGRPLTEGVVLGNTSPDWAIEDRGEVVSIPFVSSPGGVPQRFSYRDAQNAFYASLTLSLESQRRLAFGKTLLSLGHVVHHLQDMAQPQHVRNEIHLPFTPASYYEFYTEKTVDLRLSRLLSDIVFPSVQFDNVRQFWTDNAVAYRGMADFTARNYVSSYTGYGSFFGGPLMGAPGFPLPNGANALTGSKSVQSIPVRIPLLGGRVLNLLVDYVVGDIYDRGSAATPPPGTTFPGRRLAAASLLNPALVQINGLQVYRPDNNVFEDGYPILLPRAVAFSTGLIDHFFRGVASVNFNRSLTTPNTWRITTNDALNGRFTVLAEDMNGVRSEIPGAQFVLNLPRGATRDVTFTDPAPSTRRLVLAFRGQVGAEVPPDPDFQAVAATVIPYSPPPTISCPANFQATGGVEGLDRVVNVGNGQGAIVMRFEAYSIKDTLTVTANKPGGRVLYSSNGLISGSVTRSLPFDPQIDGTNLAVRVGGMQMDTAWTVALSCPGKSLGPNDFPPTRSLQYTSGSLFPGASGGCSADVFIDGTFRFIANVSATAGPTNTNVPITQGPGHGIEYRNFSCLPNTQNILLGTQFIDNFGTIRLQNLNQTGVRLFDVR